VECERVHRSSIGPNLLYESHRWDIWKRCRLCSNNVIWPRTNASQKVDVIATPGTAIVAPPIGESIPDSEIVRFALIVIDYHRWLTLYLVQVSKVMRFITMGNFLGLPAITFPSGLNQCIQRLVSVVINEMGLIFKQVILRMEYPSHSNSMLSTGTNTCFSTSLTSTKRISIERLQECLWSRGRNPSRIKGKLTFRSRWRHALY